MPDRNSADSSDTTGYTDEPPDTPFRLAFGGYVGALVASFVAVVAALTDASSVAILGTVAAGFSSGCLVGIALAGRVRGLAVRSGRTRRRRAAVVLLAAPFGTAVIASLLVPLESRFVLVALISTVAVAVTGSLLGWSAQTRYVDAITGDEPVTAWRWDPPSTPILDAVVLALWLLLSAGNASAGDWTASIVWIGLAILWACSGLAEGRWRVGPLGDTPEVRVHDAGLVMQRPYTRSIVLWTDVSHVRLRENELVLDRGLFDVRFDRDELADLEDALTEIERRLPNDASLVSTQ
ncbi:hypothetical protein [Natrinema sp. SYSU A 869]|uniref:hypothetical protein n=1 Tax=Natrinema sp. SYSU A 869 TaxID=2871694 RepID=UPI001CA40C51|nr:hypothetical protein [Natrinema sp. SYSU A 869]